MPALPEYKTRIILGEERVPLVEAQFIAAGAPVPTPLPLAPAYLKAQIPGATSRAAHGLVRKATSSSDLESGLRELLAPGAWGQAEGVLVAKPVTMVAEYYAACMLDFGSADRLPGGVLLFSTEGGSGVEGRKESLRRIPFSLVQLPNAGDLLPHLGGTAHPQAVADLLAGFIRTFARHRLIVLEANPIGVLADGTALVIDCRAEFESQAVAKEYKDLFTPPTANSVSLTPLEQMVELINAADPAGTGFIRENREAAPDGAWRVATNLCGGGGKMLWEMTTGARSDIHSMNESDTSGGLSAFKSYRIARAILGMEGSQVLLVTGSGMGFQNQLYIAAALWKALRESPTPLPALLRFGGTDEEKARALFDKVGPTLPVKVKTYFPHVFPNAMVEDIPAVAARERVRVSPEPAPAGEPLFSVSNPPGEFFFDADRWGKDDVPPGISSCPTGFLRWNAGKRTIEPVEGTRCIGCLLCETVSRLEGNGELRIRLNLPEVKS